MQQLRRLSQGGGNLVPHRAAFRARHTRVQMLTVGEGGGSSLCRETHCSGSKEGGVPLASRSRSEGGGGEVARGG